MKTILRFAAVLVAFALPAVGVVYDRVCSPETCPKQVAYLKKAREAREVRLQRARVAQIASAATKPVVKTVSETRPKPAAAKVACASTQAAKTGASI